MKANSTHIRVHKLWKWAFFAAVILSKLFFACAVYFYRENRHARQQIQQLKTELHRQQIQR